MEKENIQRFKRVTLIEEDEESTRLEEKDICKAIKDCKTSCLGKLYTEKDYPICILRLLLQKVWRLEKLSVSTQPTWT